MNEVIRGAKSTLLSFLVLTITYFSMIHFKPIWQPQLASFTPILLSLFVITFLFAAYFKQSRLSFLSLIWAGIYYLSYYGIDSDNAQLFTSSLFVFTVLTLIKERGVVTIHGALQLAMLIGAAIIAFIWINYSTSYIGPLALSLPIIVIPVLVIWQSIRRPAVAQIAILVSLIVLLLQYYKLVDLPLNVTLTILMTYHIFLVIIESYFLAYRDELTALPSRRALNQYATTLGAKYSVAMLDIDHFKKFNDNYGHDIGDQVLKLVAAKIATVKKSGNAYRYGGEEFTVVFNRKHKEQVMDELERIRKLIADYKIVIRQPKRQSKNARTKQSTTQKTVKVTISIGVADSQQQQDFQQILKQADQALYKAKKAGRNRVHS